MYQPVNQPEKNSCPQCGNSLRAGAKFCTRCGTAVAQSLPPPPPPVGSSDPTVLFPADQPPPSGQYDPTILFPADQQPYTPTPPQQFNSPLPQQQLNSPMAQSPHVPVPFANQSTRVNLSQAMQFPFAHNNWFIIMLMGSFITFVPVVGFFAVYGYMTEIIRRVINDDFDLLPEWDDFGTKIKEGFFAFCLIFIWSFLPVLVLVLPGYLMVKSGDYETGFALLYLGMFLALALVYFFIPVVWGRYAVSRQFTSGLQVQSIWQLVQNNFGRYIGNWLLAGLMLVLGMIVVSIFITISGALMVILIGLCALPFVFAATFYTVLIQSHLIGQLYRVVHS